MGVVAVPDARLDKLAEMYQPDKKTPAVIEFVDIAGLVKGASQGAPGQQVPGEHPPHGRHRSCGPLL